MKKIDEKELHELFSEIKERNQNAYNQLYEKYYKLVYGIAFSVMKNKEDSEDITNEVFTKIYKLNTEKLPVSNESSWLFTVTRNECFSYLRKSRQNISIDEIYEVPSNSEEIQEIIDTDYYNKLISGLSEQEKTIVSLKILSNFTFSKISQIMNIPIGTVQWKYYKAINSLKISIGGLVGAAIAFMVVMLRREKIYNEKPYVNVEDKSNKASENINFNDTESANNAEVSNTTDSTARDNMSSTAENANIDIQEANTSVNVNQNENISIEDKKAVEEIGANYNVDSQTHSIAENISNLIGNNKKIDNFTIIGISIGIAFLIIFVIFFKKYQQKTHKKTSK